MCGTGMILCMPTLFQHLFSCLPSRHHLLVAWGCLCACQLCHGADIWWQGIHVCMPAISKCCHTVANACLFAHYPILAMMCGGRTRPVCIPAVPSTVVWWCGTPVCVCSQCPCPSSHMVPQAHLLLGPRTIKGLCWHTCSHACYVLSTTSRHGNAC